MNCCCFSNNNQVDADVEKIQSSSAESKKSFKTLGINEMSPTKITSIASKNSDIKKNLNIWEVEIDEWKSRVESLCAKKNIIEYATCRRRDEFKQLKDLGDYLAKCEHVHDDIDKAWLVFVWITHNISIDVKKYFGSNHEFNEPQSVLERGLGLCDGFTSLYQTLCSDYMAVECASVRGFEKGFDYRLGSTKSTEENHAWNVVRCTGIHDGKLLFLDVMWATGYIARNFKLMKEFRPHYFGIPPNVFHEAHYPLLPPNTSAISAESVANPLTSEEFDALPNNQLYLHLLGLVCTNNKKTNDSQNNTEDEHNKKKDRREQQLACVRALTHVSKKNFLIEYKSQTELSFDYEMYDMLNNEYLTKTIAEETRAPDESDAQFTYSFMIKIPESKRNYLVRLYAQKSPDKKPNRKPEFLITEFLLTREEDNNTQPDDEKNSENDDEAFSAFGLTFKRGIRLVSHSSVPISYHVNPLRIEFAIADERMHACVISRSSANSSILCQRDPITSNLVVLVSLHKQNEKLFMNLFASDHIKTLIGQSIGEFNVERTNSDQNDLMRFCCMYTSQSNHHRWYVYSPLQYELEKNTEYEFKYYVRGAVDVVLIDSDRSMTSLGRSSKSDEKDVWFKQKWRVEKKGRLSVFAKFSDSSYTLLGVCYYQIK